MRLTLFDLDHTLLDGDSDQLWCEFLLDRGVLPREPFASLNRAMARDYAAGEVSAKAFCDFYIGTLAGRSAGEWGALRRDYVDQCIVPRIPAAALELVARHRDAGDLVLLTTATCRFLSELTAVHLGFAQLIATELEVVDGDQPAETLGHLFGPEQHGAGHDLCSATWARCMTVVSASSASSRRLAADGHRPSGLSRMTAMIAKP